jgi:hypothetical protein
MDSMICLLTVPSGPSGVRQVRISVPLVAPLLDGVRYFLPDTLPPPEGEDLRPQRRPRLDVMVRQVLRREAEARLEARHRELARRLAG